MNKTIYLMFGLGISCNPQSNISQFKGESLEEKIDQEEERGNPAERQVEFKVKKWKKSKLKKYNQEKKIDYKNGEVLDMKECNPQGSETVCTHRFYVPDIHCWDARDYFEPSETPVRHYIFTSDIPDVIDLYGVDDTPKLCGYATTEGTFDSWFIRVTEDGETNVYIQNILEEWEE